MTTNKHKIPMAKKKESKNVRVVACCSLNATMCTMAATVSTMKNRNPSSRMDLRVIIEILSVAVFAGAYS